MCRRFLAGPMTLRWGEEAPRLARLARLELDAHEAEALARACEAITGEFSDLAHFAMALPAPEHPPLGGLRADDPEPAPLAEADAILEAVPRADPATREVLVPRGL